MRWLIVDEDYVMPSSTYRDRRDGSIRFHYAIRRRDGSLVFRAENLADAKVIVENLQATHLDVG